MSDQARDNIGRWFEYRLPVWQAAAERLARIERGKSAPPDMVISAVREYPEIARDLAIARRHAPTGMLTRHLERTYLHLHRMIFRRPERLKQDLERIFLSGAANAAYALRWHIAWVTALFLLCAAAGYWLIASFPELATLFASEDMIDGLAAGQLWTEGILNIMPSSVLSVQIFTNNIAVALTTLCLGVFYGLGTVYIIGLNGLMLGGVFALTERYGLAGRLFEFIAAHGFVELSVICLAGAVGASLGEALARPGELTRSAAFRKATARGGELVLVGAAFLVGAGLIEGHVSPNPAFPLSARLAIGLTYWVLLLLTLSGGLGRLLRRSVAPVPPVP
jgi:uncharacterized membrane protein SpoIIM required for sporulation